MITPAKIAAMFAGFNARFNKQLKLAKPWWSMVATEMPSTGESETYAWEDFAPQMREWIGERLYGELRAYGYTLVNKTYELSQKVPRDKIEDDKYMIFATPRLDNMAQSVAKWADTLLALLFLLGESIPSYDGVNFYDTDHPIDPYDPLSAVQSNLFDLELTPDNYGTVRNAMMALVGSNGLPLGVMPTLLVVPPQLADTGKRILQSDLITRAITGTGAAAESNIHKGTAELLVMPELASQPTAWHLLATEGHIKPYLVQSRTAPEFVAKDKATDDSVFERDEYRYGARRRGNVGHSLWQFAAKSVPAP